MHFTVTLVVDVQLVLDRGEVVGDVHVGVAKVVHLPVVLSALKIVHWDDAEVDVQVVDDLDARRVRVEGNGNVLLIVGIPRDDFEADGGVSGVVGVAGPAVLVVADRFVVFFDGRALCFLSAQILAENSRSD